MAYAVVVEIVVAVDVVAAGFLVAEAEIERCGAVVVVVDAQPELVMAALAGKVFGRVHDGSSDAVGAELSWPDLQPVQLRARGVALPDLWCRASVPPDLTHAQLDPVRDGDSDQERAAPLLLALPPLGLGSALALQLLGVFWLAGSDLHQRLHGRILVNVG